VARLGQRTTAFGAFYDSTLDRVGEGALFGGIALYFLRGGVPVERLPIAVMVTLVALVSSLLVSYTRARAEALGLECRVGIAARAERLLLLGAPPLFFGAGPNGALLLWIVVALAIATTITVVQRVVHVARIADRAPGAVVKKRDTLPGHAAAMRKGH
jgi:CDP-diacylglycerol--glycerol-3-phosphate 3-phosphatidyltransferase